MNTPTDGVLPLDAEPLRAAAAAHDHRWYPRPGDGDRIWAHLLRQRGIDQAFYVRLDDGRTVRVGSDADGET